MDSQLCTNCEACLLERVFVLCNKAGKFTQVPHLVSRTRKHAVQPPSFIGLNLDRRSSRCRSRSQSWPEIRTPDTLARPCFKRPKELRRNFMGDLFMNQ